MKPHIDYICKKVAKKIGFLARISRKLPIRDRVLLYKSIIAPHFEHCPSILFTSDENDFSRLQKLQNRVILRYRKSTSIASMLEALCWLNVKQRTVYQTMVMVFRVKHQLAPACMNRNLTYIGETHGHKVRNANDFRLHKVNKKSTTKTLFYKGLQTFNGLPWEIKGNGVM